MTEVSNNIKATLPPVAGNFVKHKQETTIGPQGVEMSDDWFIRRLDDDDYIDFLQIDPRSDGGKEKIMIMHMAWMSPLVTAVA